MIPIIFTPNAADAELLSRKKAYLPIPDDANNPRIDLRYEDVDQLVSKRQIKKPSTNEANVNSKMIIAKNFSQIKEKYNGKKIKRPPDPNNEKLSNKLMTESTIGQAHKCIGTSDIEELEAVNLIISDISKLDYDYQIEIANNVSELVKTIIKSQYEENNSTVNISQMEVDEEDDENDEDYDEELETYDDDDNYDNFNISINNPFNQKTNELMDKKTKAVLSNLSKIVATQYEPNSTSVLEDVHIENRLQELHKILNDDINNGNNDEHSNINTSLKGNRTARGSGEAFLNSDGIVDENEELDDHEGDNDTVTNKSKRSNTKFDMTLRKKSLGRKKSI
jgi:hypothetical protein